MTCIRLGLLIVGLCLLHQGQANAQQTATSDPQDQRGLTAIGKKAVDIFSKPLHPVVESVAPGGGFGPGIAYRTPRRGGEPWTWGAKALITLRKYWLAQTSAAYQGTWLHSEMYGRARDMTRLDFYGIGADASLDDRANYRFTERSIGGLASARFPEFDLIALGGRLEALWPEIDVGRNRAYPSIGDRFTEADAPGLAVQPTFTSATAFVNVNYPGGNALGRHGVDFHVAYSAYRDHDDGAYDFRRLNLESQQRVRGVSPSHTLTLHQWFSTTSTDGDSVVPFYFQHTLGGAGAVRTFNEEILGSDGTKATLRGFRDLRFRGPHLSLLQAEYRVKVVGPIDVTFFVDAGAVASHRSQIGFNRMKTDGGFSLSLMTVDATALRIDVGTGGGEGTRVFFTVGPIFQR